MTSFRLGSTHAGAVWEGDCGGTRSMRTPNLHLSLSARITYLQPQLSNRSLDFRGGSMNDILNSAREVANLSPFTRRSFLVKTSCFGAFYAVAKLIPMPALAAELASDSRVSQTPVVDKGFASVRKIGNGLYATISDYSKGTTTICNGGFLAGKDGALLIEGFTTPMGAAFQMDALRMVSRVPVTGALDTHYHFDHSMGNSFYGANGVQLWALATAPALPNHPLDPAKLPMPLALGGLTAVIESYPRHSGTDVIVRVPDQNVVYAGDLLFSGWYPVCFDEKATISGWRGTLKKFASFDKDTLFVPGHGEICGQEGIASIREVL